MSWVFATDIVTTFPIKKGEARDWFEKMTAGELDCFEIMGQTYGVVDFRLSVEGSYISFRRLQEEVKTSSITSSGEGA